MTASRARWTVPLAGILALTGLLLPAVAPTPVRAAEYAMETDASYEVRPTRGEIEVTVDVTFTNTTPDPAGRFSVFEEVRVAVQDDATDVRAEDDDGQLTVETAVENRVNVATVRLRDEVRYEETAEFTLRWTLPDTDDPLLRVRPSVVVFPAWGFGTASRVAVSIPDGYVVSVDGDPLREDGGALVSGPIEDPSRWLALVTAARPAEFEDFRATVPLEGGTADLRVRAFVDDAAWGERTVALLTDALPRIEEEVGLPYPRIGELVVTEAVGAAGLFEDPGIEGGEILVAFEQPPFTALHQVTHVWISPTLAQARWLREGLASHVASRVAADLDVSPPFDPDDRVDELADASFPLDRWSANAGPDGEAYGHAASWAFIDAIAAHVGPETIRTVLARASAAIGPYQSADVEPVPGTGNGGETPTPLTTRAFLDHLEMVTGRSLADRFARVVLTGADVDLLPAREEARAAYTALVDAAGSWQAPDPVRGAMSAWEFAEAETQIAEARAWLRQRNELLGAMEAVGLSAPDRLRQAYRTYGGGPEAVAELDAERAVVDAYAATATSVNGPRSLLERIGLLGVEDPAEQLNLANGRVADGDLRGALDALAEAQRVLAASEAGGIVRVVSLVLVVLVLLGLAVLLVRRRASYTAAP